MSARRAAVFAAPLIVLASPLRASERSAAIDALVARYAAAHGVPERLVHRVIQRESRYRPGVVSRGNFGLMQIKPATARGMGFSGSPSKLLDPETNLAHAVPYLANAFRVARGDENAAVRYYASGWYFAAKRMGILGSLRTARSTPLSDAADR